MKGVAIVAAGIAAGFLCGVGAAVVDKPLYRKVQHAVVRVRQASPDDNDIRSEKAPLYAGSPPAAVTLLGDSLTDFGDWPKLLPGVPLDNHGIAGETSIGLAQRVAKGEPTGATVFVEIGVNDTNAGLDVGESEHALAAIVDRLRGKAIYLQSTVLTRVPRLNERVAALDAYERRLCADRRCTFVDLNRALAPQGVLRADYTVDGVHLGWAGYAAWAGIIDGLMHG